MQQVITNSGLPTGALNAKLYRGMLIASGICLLAIFYFKGTFRGVFTSPEPQPLSAAGAGPLMKVSSASDVVTAALNFKAMLTTAQQATLEKTYTTTLARKWSNLPCGSSCRNGIALGDLTASQLTAALAVMQAALGSSTDNGYDELIQNRLAEAILHSSGGGSGYDTTLRWIAFLNTPTATGAWMLQFGGHHYAANIAFNNGHVIGATPFFQGLEPLSFTFGGTTYAPLTDEHDAFTAMLASLSSSELSTAKLSSSFSDCTMVPGESNGGTGTFPSTKVGLSCGSLTTTQKNLVLAAIKSYVDDMDTATANHVMATYTSEIDDTYIAFTGSGTVGDASTFLNANANYVRIDGPGVWIELACQNGVIFPSQIHYHTVWRDHNHDYGVDLSGDAIDASSSTGIVELKNNASLKLYPNPTGDKLSLNLSTNLEDASLVIISAISGKVVYRDTHVKGNDLQYDLTALTAGVYLMRIEDKGVVFSQKFSKL